MPAALVIEDGPTVELCGSPAQGSRHTVLFGTLAGTGERVAVKLGRGSGALARERVALASLGAREGPVPRLVVAGPARFGGERVDCLVIERRRYLETVRPVWHPTREEQRWWMTAAGIQFIHRRRKLGDRPAPWQDAAEILRAHLADDGRSSPCARSGESVPRHG